MRFNIMAILFVCLLGFYSCEEHETQESLVTISAGEMTNFPTVGFEQIAEVEIPFPVDDVFSLFEPAGRNLLYSWWNPTVLRDAMNGTMNNLITVSPVQIHGAPVDAFLAVKEYDSVNKTIQYVVLWGDFELQRIDVRCEEGTTANSTKVIWTERNAGLHQKGTTAVTTFVQGGGIESSLERYARGIEETLELEKNGVTMTSTLNATSQNDTNFPIVGFEQTIEAEIPFPVDDVFPLFEPAGRNLMYSWWNPATTLREAATGTMNNLVTVSQPHGHGSSPIDVFLAVTDYNSANKTIQYIVLWDDFELQRIDIKCEQGTTTNSTKVVWTERNAGFHQNGVSAVTNFVQSGELATAVEHYAKGIENFLKD